MYDLQEVQGKHRIIILAGSGKSVSLLPENLFASCFVISLNWTFKLIPKTDICFISDYKKEDWIKLDSCEFPEIILTKYDFDQRYAFDVSKNLKSITSSSTSAMRGLDLAYKLNPEIILITGVDFRGKTIGIDYDDPKINNLLDNEALAMAKAIEKIRKEGIKVFNISPYSRLKQDISIEEFIRCHF